MALRRVVVTGLGALTPIGNNIQDYWNALVNGVSGAAPITYYDTEKHKTKFACEVKNFDGEKYFEKKEKFVRDGSKYKQILRRFLFFPFGASKGNKTKYFPLANAINDVVKQDAHGKPYHVIYGSLKWLCV